MFGWEYPPHISGGLGTACYGITHALSKEKVQVIFVVPKLHGDEPTEDVKLVNASAVMIPTKETVLTTMHEKKVRKPRKKIKTFITESVKYIEVASTLVPYQAVEPQSKFYKIEHWNYQLPDAYAVIEEERKVLLEGISYSFSGTYGPNLLEEVERYADVGRQIAKKFDFDVIHAHDWMTYAAGIGAKEVSGKPLVAHVHATEFDRSGKYVNRPVFKLEWEGLKQADAVIAVSQWTKDVIAANYQIPAHRVNVVHNGIIPKRRSLSSPLQPSPIGKRIVTFLGRITYQKGPQYFVEAARKVLEQCPDTHFVVVGSGDLLPQMIERVAQLKMSSRFHFTGFLKGESIDKIWSISNVYVMPSVSEPFGIAPLEAIQSKVPVIVSNQSGVAEVMPHAIKVDFWNTTELAGAICSVLKYKSLSNTLKKHGEEEIQNLTWERAAKKIKTIYHECITQHDSRK
jgi:glycosyltransferase involved in cell wall biosynthesis